MSFESHSPQQTKQSIGPNGGLLAMRAILAVVFTVHGAQKLFGWFGGYGIAGTADFFANIGIPFATLNAYLAGGVELVGGLALLAGLGFRISAGLLFFTMMVASTTAHTGFNAAQGGFEYPLTLAVVSLGLALTGPGEWTLSKLARSHQGDRASITGNTRDHAAAAGAR